MWNQYFILRYLCSYPWNSWLRKWIDSILVDLVIVFLKVWRDHFSALTNSMEICGLGFVLWLFSTWKCYQNSVAGNLTVCFPISVSHFVGVFMSNSEHVCNTLASEFPIKCYLNLVENTIVMDLCNPVTWVKKTNHKLSTWNYISVNCKNENIQVI